MNIVQSLQDLIKQSLKLRFRQVEWSIDHEFFEGFVGCQLKAKEEVFVVLEAVEQPHYIGVLASMVLGCNCPNFVSFLLLVALFTDHLHGNFSLRDFVLSLDNH